MRLMNVVLLLLVPVPLVFSQVRVVTHLDPAWASEDGVGFAQEMFRRMTTLAGQPAELDVYPINRAINVFLREDADCYFGSDQRTWQDLVAPISLPLISSAPFTRDSVYAFTPAKKDIISNTRQLQKASLVMRRESQILLEQVGVLHNLKAENITIVPSLEIGLTMVQSGRVDALVRFKSMLTDEFSNEMHYDEAFPLYSVIDSINCHDSENAQSYINQIDASIKEGLDKGRFADLFKTYRRPEP